MSAPRAAQKEGEMLLMFASRFKVVAVLAVLAFLAPDLISAQIGLTGNWNANCTAFGVGGNCPGGATIELVIPFTPGSCGGQVIGTFSCQPVSNYWLGNVPAGVVSPGTVIVARIANQAASCSIPLTVPQCGAGVPAVSDIGMIIMAVVLLAAAIWTMRKKSAPAT